MTQMAFLMAIFLAACLSPGYSSPYHEDYREDIVGPLPGLDVQPTFKHYSGYLRSNDGKYLHYWLTESQRSPIVDPLVLWLNGGPGCSSLDGLLTENGPFIVGKNGQSLNRNPYSWNKIANMLFLDAPAGVGFSFSDDKNYTTNDDITADDNMAAIQDFFRKFPHYQGRDFYITGESYAGIYIPTLMVRIMEDKSIKLKGAAIGNGYLKPPLLESTMFPYWYYHGMMDTSTWEELQDACCTNNNGSDCQYAPFRTRECEIVASRVAMEAVSWAVNPYMITGPCRGDKAPKAQARTTAIINLFMAEMTHDFTDKQVFSAFDDFHLKISSSSPCTDDTDINSYLNRQDVQQALHIPAGLPTYEMCSSVVTSGGLYKNIYKDMSPQLQKIVESKDYRILIYNGDLDTVCNFFGVQHFVDDLGMKVTHGHHPWYYEGCNGYQQVGGFAKNFEKLTYITVKGAGHMVPTDQPRSSYDMFFKFLHDLPF